MNQFLVILCAAYFIFYTPVFATEFTSANFKVLDSVIKPAAGFSTSSAFQLWQSIGQEAIGLSDSVSFGLRGGFLYFLAPAAPAAPPSQVTPPGGGGGQLVFKFPPIISKAVSVCDFNDDGACDIVDLSILLYYLTQPLVERYDLNNDGRIGLIDISILFYYWTSE